ncbi:molybdenum cofactor guanylyltransferase [Paenibacillus luteus]|uniref:molybdenum cofactor guanylyltransferase n=1 Tax=Paenibacillus luteus TaxID=2545753 RepID=UPI0011447003|nr:molybdenum cofactor guanylyltransferase [Paenibacillus luteus]
MGKYPIGSLILAGGHSSRMGTDKALLPIDGKPLLYRLVQQLSNLTQKVTVSVGTTQREAIYRQCLGDLGEKVGYAVDRYPERGPLSGLHAGLSSQPEGYLFVMACDMPNVSEELFEKLMSYNNSRVDVIHVMGQPFHALYHTRALRPIEAALQEGDYRLLGLLRRMASIEVALPENICSNLFTNLNTPADYEAYSSEG